MRFGLWDGARLPTSSGNRVAAEPRQTAHNDAASKRRRSTRSGDVLSRAQWVGTDLLREHAELRMTGQRGQAPLDEGARSL